MKNYMLSISLLFTFLSCYGQTYVSGDISGTWPKDGNPYFVIDDCTVNSGNTLTIEPGVEILIGKDLSINVYGLLKAEGTEDEAIIFRSPSDTVYWNRILIQNSASVLKHCKFSDAATALYLNKSCACNSTTTVEILNCEFNNCSENAIYARSHGSNGWTSHSPILNPIISNCIFKDSENGIYLYLSGIIVGTPSRGRIYGTIKNNLFGRIKGTAIRCQKGNYAGNSYVDIENNTLINCWRGIYTIEPYDVSTCNNILRNCSIGIERTGSLSSTVNNNCLFSSDSAYFIGYPSAYGQVVMSNSNGDPCDIASNIYMAPEFSDTSDYYLAAGSPCIDAGVVDVEYYDICLPPAGGTQVNDMGKHGGPGSCGYLKMEITPGDLVVEAFADTLSYAINNTGTGVLNWSVHVPVEDTSWLRIISDTSGSNFDSIHISMSFNPGINRTGKFVINAPGGVNTPDTIYINQGNYLPDLTIKNMVFEPSEVERGGIVKISGQYNNVGLGPSISSMIGFYLSQDDIFNLAEDRFVGFAYLDSISHGFTYDYETGNLSVPVDINSGSWKMLGIINPDSSILESDFSNNTSITAITIIEIISPGNFTLTAVSPGNISLTWTDNTDIETGYEIYRSIEGPVHESFELIRTTPENTVQYSDTMVQLDTLYYYKIRAINETERSSFTEVQFINTNYGGVGLLAWYPFSGNANDQTGNGHDGAVIDAILTTDKDSTENKAYSFNGIGAYIDIGDSVKPRDPIYPLAFSAWFVCDAFTEENICIMKNDTGRYGAMIQVNSIGKIISSVGDGSKNATNTTQIPVITPGAWHHIAVNYLSTSQMEIFINGKEYEGIFKSGASSLKYSADKPGAIGSGHSEGFLKGKIDEVRIYARALTAEDMEFLSGFEAERPISPLNLKAEAVSSSEILLTWLDNFNDETGFEILRSPPPGDAFNIYDTVGANAISFADTGLDYFTTYYYQLRAMHPGGYSHLTEVASATTQAEGVPYAEDKLCCLGNPVPPLYAEGENIKWYSEETLTNLIHSGHDFYTGKTEIGSYSYYVTQQYKGSESLPNKVTLTISEVPELLLQPYKNEIHQGEKITLAAGGASIYQWQPQDLFESIDGGNATISPDRNTVFSLRGYNQNGCYDSVAIPVSVYCDPCSDDQVLFNLFGYINHGCKDRNYNNNANCSWTIMPSSAQKVFLKINPDSFDIKTGDKLLVYDGLNTTGPLLGTFDNNNLPEGIVGAGNSMYIKLVSDDANTGSGFQARFWTDLTSSVETGDAALDYIIYPNPAQEIINVRINASKFINSTISILDLTGRRLIVKYDLTLGDNAILLNGIEKGLHLIEIRTKDLVKYEFFVIR